ncbi:MAG: hypothetical protein R3A52_15295 [Polyangiales bacterium]
MALSLALHAGLLLFRLAPLHGPKIPVHFNPVVELGIEEARPGPTTPPAATEPPTPEATPAPAPPPRREAPRRVHRPAPPPPREENPEPPLALPEPPSVDLRAPTMARAEPSIDFNDDAGVGEDVSLALSDDAGVGEDVALAALDDVVDASAPGAVPGLRDVEPGLAAAVPQGSAVSLLMRTDRLRNNPNGPAVARLLDGIRDWQMVLGGTELNPIEDFDAILLASANPMMTRGRPADMAAVVRARASRDFLRASVEQMAGARENSPAVRAPDAGTLRQRVSSRDAGPLPAPTRPVWRRENGVEVAEVDRYIGPLTVALMPGNMAVIAPRERIAPLLTILRGSRAMAAASDDTGPASRLVVLLEARGVRNLMNIRGDVSLVPERGELAVIETRRGGRADGGAELAGRFMFENEAQARRASRLLQAFFEEMDEAVGQFAVTLQGRIASGTGAVHFDRLHRALRALRATHDGSALVIEATLASDEVRELLNAQQLAAMFQ